MWALKDHVSDILKPFQDQTLPSNCLIFYRPSFGRAGGKKTAEFGEFDAVIASLTNIYLIQSKWDNLALGKKTERAMRRVQVLRHHIFSWYITHWKRTYCNNWGLFVAEQEDNFTKAFRKPIARSGTLLAKNPEFVLSMLLEHCKGLSGEQNVKNVLVFFFVFP